jgi:hypothetical protein
MDIIAPITIIRTQFCQLSLNDKELSMTEEQWQLLNFSMDITYKTNFKYQ